MKSLGVLLKTELTLAVRHLDGILFGMIFPVGIVLLMGTIYGSKPAAENLSYTMMQLSFGAFVAIGICATGLMGLPLNLADYRHKKILKRFKVTPISPMKLLTAQVFTQFIFALVSGILVFATATLVFDYSMTGSVIKFILAYTLVLVTIYSIGMVIASTAPNMKTANFICTLVYFPSLFLSGATIPYEIMPKSLQMVADILPLTQGIKLLKNVSLDIPQNNITFQLLLLSSISLVCILVSLKFFKWE